MEEIIVVAPTVGDDLPIASTTDPGRILNSDDYAVFENVPVFVEHQRALKNGRTLQFGKRELELVANRSNRRIEETGDFAPVVIGHTSSESSAAKPPKIGWAGPFRLGWLTPAKDKLAILADFRIEKDKVGLLKEYPRRSAEIWAEENYEDMYLDPISLLGADTPWSDMGVLYAKENGGVEKVYYSIAPQAPSAYSGLPGPVKVAKTEKKEKYSMNENGLSSEQQEIAQTIVTAILETPEFKFLRRQMKEQNGALGDEQAAPLATAPQKAEPIPDAEPLEPVDEAPIGDEAPEAGEPLDEDKQKYAADSDGTAPPDAGDLTGAELDAAPNGSLGDEGLELDDDGGDSDLLGRAPGGANLSLVDEFDSDDDDFKKEKYAAREDEGNDELDDLDEESDEGDELDDEKDSFNNEDDEDLGDDYDDEDLGDDGNPIYGGNEDMDRTGSIGERLSSLEKKVRNLQLAFDWTTNKVVSRERYSKLSDLRENYVFDEGAEREKCRYNKMTDAQFAKRCEEIATNYRRVPTAIKLPPGLVRNAPAELADRPGAVQYSKERGDDLEAEVMRLSDMYSAKGVSKSSEELRDEARKNCGDCAR